MLNIYVNGNISSRQYFRAVWYNNLLLECVNCDPKYFQIKYRLSLFVIILSPLTISCRSSCEDQTLSNLAQTFREKHIQYDCIENRQ